MKRLNLLLLLLLGAFSLQAQTDEPIVYTVVEEMPTYIGGDEARIKFLTDSIRYPAFAKESGIQGTVFITFVIDEKGAVTDVRLLRGIGGGCDEEAVRVTRLMPRWNPGKQSGDPVRVQFNMPIKFTLGAGKKDKDVKTK
jgi:periplasmic protein TonB